MLGEMTQEIKGWQDILPQIGYPPLPADEIPPCGKKRVCTKKGKMICFEETARQD
jgi:hypothetical protein